MDIRDTRHIIYTRTKAMKEMRDAGYTYNEIGKEFNISRQRVDQLINDYRTIRSHARKNIIIAAQHYCQVCKEKKKNNELYIHRINGNPHDNNIDNLLVVCRECHKKADRKTRELLGKKRLYRGRGRQIFNKKCRQCGRGFKSFIEESIFCSRQCRDISRRIYRTVEEKRKIWRDRQKLLYKENPKVREYYKKYNKEHPEYMERWQQKNRKKINERSLARYYENVKDPEYKEKLKLYRKKYAENKKK